MRIAFKIHSTTGNTKLVADYAAGWFRNQGQRVSTRNIELNFGYEELDSADLLVLACPTMYFRPTLVMEKFVQGLPSLPDGERRPVFLLGTCMGEPGAHFPLLTEALEPKGWKTMGAHWVVCPSNYPTYRALVKPLERISAVKPYLSRRPAFLRPLWWFLWPGEEPDESDREELDSALRQLMHVLESHGMSTQPLRDHPVKVSRVGGFLGRRISSDMFDRIVRPRIDRARCESCGLCVETCPAGIFSRSAVNEIFISGGGCTGCFACYNMCPNGAVSAMATPAGKGMYKGPTESMKLLFTPPG